MIEINIVNPEDTINKEELKEKFFTNTLPMSELNEYELRYYSDELATVKTEVYYIGYIHFDCRQYTIINGLCVYSYNSKKALTKKRYKVFELFNLGVNEKLSKIINDIFDEKTIVFTNINTDSLLGRDIAKKGKFKIGRNSNTKNEVDIKIYQDLIGAIENQNDIGESFFYSEKISYADPKSVVTYDKPYTHRYGNPENLFLNAIDAITTTTTTPENNVTFPSEIVALVNWFSKIPNI